MKDALINICARCSHRRLLALRFAILATIVFETTASADPSAEDLYVEGQGAYDRADYATAIARWQASYDLSHEPGLLFNLAHAWRLSGDCPRALTAYKRFMADDPTAEQRPIAEGFVRELETACPPKAELAIIVHEPQKSADRPTPREDHIATRPSGRSLKTAGLATSGIGLVVLTTGLVLGHHAASIGNEVTSACRVTCDWERWRTEDAAGRRDATIGRALDAVGVIGIAGGAALYYLGVTREVAVVPNAHDGGAVVTWSRAW